MLITTFPLTPFQQNTRVVACERTRRAICIDPGEQSDELVAFINDNGLTLHSPVEAEGSTQAFIRQLLDLAVRGRQGSFLVGRLRRWRRNTRRHSTVRC